MTFGEGTRTPPVQGIALKGENVGVLYNFPLQNLTQCSRVEFYITSHPSQQWLRYFNWLIAEVLKCCYLVCGRSLPPFGKVLREPKLAAERCSIIRSLKTKFYLISASTNQNSTPASTKQTDQRKPKPRRHQEGGAEDPAEQLASADRRPCTTSTSLLRKTWCCSFYLPVLFIDWC